MKSLDSKSSFLDSNKDFSDADKPPGIKKQPRKLTAVFFLHKTKQVKRLRVLLVDGNLIVGLGQASGTVKNQ